MAASILTDPTQPSPSEQNGEYTWIIDDHMSVRLIPRTITRFGENGPVETRTAIEFTNPTTATTLNVSEKVGMIHGGLVNTHSADIQIQNGKDGSEMKYHIFQPVANFLNPDDSFVFNNASLNLPQGIDIVTAIRNCRHPIHAITHFLCGNNRNLSNQILAPLAVSEDLLNRYANELTIDMEALLRSVFPHLPYNEDEFHKHPFTQLFIDRLPNVPQEKPRVWETSDGSILWGFKPWMGTDRKTKSPKYTLRSVLKTDEGTMEIIEEFQEHPISQRVDIVLPNEKLICLEGNSSRPILTTYRNYRKPPYIDSQTESGEYVPAILGRSASLALLQHLTPDKKAITDWLDYVGLDPRLLANHKNKVTDDLEYILELHR